MVLDGFVVYTENLRKLVGVTDSVRIDVETDDPAADPLGYSESVSPRATANFHHKRVRPQFQ